MAGQVTETRRTPQYPRMYFTRTIGGVTTSGDHYSSGGAIGTYPSQITTSYRTGVRGPEDDRSELPTTQIEAIRGYKDEYEEQRYRRSGDNGHPFESTKEELYCTTFQELVDSTGRTYKGHIFPSPTSNTLYSGSRTWIPIPSWNSGWHGSTAIERCRPTTSVANLAAAAAELKRDGLPSFEVTDGFKRRTAIAKGDKPGPSGLLNFEFGWKPLISDVRSVAMGLKNARRHIEQLQRDSGRWVRRRYVFPNEVLLNTTREGSGILAGPTGMGTTFESQIFPFGRSGHLTETLQIERQVWFSGAFSYHLPGGETLVGKAREREYEINYILGTRITPSTLWQIAPWSWLVDWKLNVGTLISNAEAIGSDGLVIRYGYLMCRTTTQRTVTVEGVRSKGGTTLPPATVVYRKTRKQRVVASPYGFGLNPSGFTDRQWTILSALGMTRGPRSLKTTM
jgi:hypothetical protein